MYLYSYVIENMSKVLVNVHKQILDMDVAGYLMPSV